jgi:hypothetical protein
MEYYQSPQVGFEPTTNRLTADRSTTELLKISFANYFYFNKRTKKNQFVITLILNSMLTKKTNP